ncbi:hypothetical protein [Engelhardtia mirabilis]|uniref:Terminase-like family protein n=1 Tax=Engelhardtia mirabilis TaxID=2528011 RepID=A0A518BL48_9BACT|nr:hypothetical protein Pla133_27840 [Planctomycetes bacterium Pla133]QDV02022.1 hypothetical protein Pla86_27830 [Planctomycetes bacterium Pla86]
MRAARDCRLVVAGGGRRSGKSEWAKRHNVGATFEPFTAPGPPGWCVFAAPTHQQAKRIYWKDLLSFIPRGLIRKVVKSELTIELATNWDITVLGMDAPERVEGRPLDRFCGDEFDDFRDGAWEEHARPAMGTPGRLGWAWLYGTPNGRGRLWRMLQRIWAGEMGKAFGITWTSEGVVPDEEIAEARAQLDERTFRQEYMASFELTTSRAYYEFDPVESILRPGEAEYDPNAPLLIGLDFNREPGIAVVAQDLPYRGERAGIDPKPTVMLGEVYIPRSSTTPAVCRKLLEDWGNHQGPWVVYGDASGGRRTSQAVSGSDWDLVKDHLLRFTKGHSKLSIRRANPPVISRIVAVNSRLRSADGVRHMLFSKAARHLIEDMEGTQILEGSAGELDKSDGERTHLSDGAGYLIEKRYTLPGRATVGSGSIY